MVKQANKEFHIAHNVHNSTIGTATIGTATIGTATIDTATIGTATIDTLIDSDKKIPIEGQILRSNPAGKPIWSEFDTKTNLSDLEDVNLTNNLANGQILQYNSTTGKWENNELFKNYNGTDEVRSTIGHVTAGTKVSTLRNNNDTIDDVIAKMLNIQPAAEPTPSVSNHNITIGDNNNTVKLLYGSSYSYNLSLNYNRGTWSNAYSDDGITPTDLLPYTPGVAIYNGDWEYANDTNITPDNPQAITVSSPLNVTYTATSINNVPLNVWKNHELNVSMTPKVTDGIVYTVSPYINPYQLPPPNTLTVSKTWKVYKPVFVNGEQTTAITGNPNGKGYSKETQTVEVFIETTDIIIVNHNINHQIAIPFEFDPSNPLHLVGEYESQFSDEYNEVISFTSVPISHHEHPYLPSLETSGVSTYHLVTLYDTGRTDLVDVKLTKTGILNPE